jgi:hypothetical protein
MAADTKHTDVKQKDDVVQNRLRQIFGPKLNYNLLFFVAGQRSTNKLLEWAFPKPPSSEGGGTEQKSRKRKRPAPVSIPVEEPMALALGPLMRMPIVGPGIPPPAGVSSDVSAQAAIASRAAALAAAASSAAASAAAAGSGDIDATDLLSIPPLPFSGAAAAGDGGGGGAGEEKLPVVLFPVSPTFEIGSIAIVPREELAKWEQEHDVSHDVIVDFFMTTDPTQISLTQLSKSALARSQTVKQHLETLSDDELKRIADVESIQVKQLKDSGLTSFAKIDRFKRDHLHTTLASALGPGLEGLLGQAEDEPVRLVSPLAELLGGGSAEKMTQNIDSRQLIMVLVDVLQDFGIHAHELDFVGNADLGDLLRNKHFQNLDIAFLLLDSCLLQHIPGQFMTPNTIVIPLKGSDSHFKLVTDPHGKIVKFHRSDPMRQQFAIDCLLSLSDRISQFVPLVSMTRQQISEAEGQLESYLFFNSSNVLERSVWNGLMNLLTGSDTWSQSLDVKTKEQVKHLLQTIESWMVLYLPKGGQALSKSQQNMVDLIAKIRQVLSKNM